MNSVDKVVGTKTSILPVPDVQLVGTICAPGPNYVHADETILVMLGQTVMP
jgi:hypothetical protein